MFYSSGYTEEQPNVERSRNIRKDLQNLTQVYKYKSELNTPGPNALIAELLGTPKYKARDLFNQPGGKRKTRKMRKSKKI